MGAPRGRRRPARRPARSPARHAHPRGEQREREPGRRGSRKPLVPRHALDLAAGRPRGTRVGQACFEFENVQLLTADGRVLMETRADDRREQAVYRPHVKRVLAAGEPLLGLIRGATSSWSAFRERRTRDPRRARHAQHRHALPDATARAGRSLGARAAVPRAPRRARGARCSADFGAHAIRRHAFHRLATQRHGRDANCHGRQTRRRSSRTRWRARRGPSRARFRRGLGRRRPGAARGHAHGASHHGAGDHASSTSRCSRFLVAMCVGLAPAPQRPRCRRRAMEITGRHAARARLITAIAPAFDAIFTFDRRGRIRTVNRGGVRSFGASAADLDGQARAAPPRLGHARRRQLCSRARGRDDRAGAAPDGVQVAGRTAARQLRLRGRTALHRDRARVNRAASGVETAHPRVCGRFGSRNRRLEEMNAQLEEASRLKASSSRTCRTSCARRSTA